MTGKKVKVPKEVGALKNTGTSRATKLGWYPQGPIATGQVFGEMVIDPNNPKKQYIVSRSDKVSGNMKGINELRSPYYTGKPSGKVPARIKYQGIDVGVLASTRLDNNLNFVVDLYDPANPGEVIDTIEDEMSVGDFMDNMNVEAVKNVVGNSGLGSKALLFGEELD